MRTAFLTLFAFACLAQAPLEAMAAGPASFASYLEDIQRTIERINNPSNLGCRPNGAEHGYVHQVVINGKRDYFDSSPIAKNIIWLRNEQDDGSVSSCTGTLISKDVVQIAAHCVKGKNRASMEALFMANFSDGSQRNYKTGVAKVVFHEGFGKDRLIDRFMNQPLQLEQNDIALLFLEANAPDTYEPVGLPTQPVISKKCRYYIAGFGAAFGDPNAQNDEHSALFDETDETRFSRSGEVAFSDIKIIRSGNKKAFEISGGPTSCRGDSGGPMIEVCGKRHKLVGVASTAARGCRTGRYTATHPHRAWILGEITKYRSGNSR